MVKPRQHSGQVPSARILIIDDEPQNIAILVKLLRENGYDVRAARNADHALQTLEIETVDLILLDIRMPKMTGFEFCETLKQEQRTASIPVIFLTALNEVEDKVRGLELGAVDYITKPFCELLKQQPDATIIDLAFQSGYNSKSVFNRWFKTVKKTTPKKFRKTFSSDTLG